MLVVGAGRLRCKLGSSLVFGAELLHFGLMLVVGACRLHCKLMLPLVLGVCFWCSGMLVTGPDDISSFAATLLLGVVQLRLLTRTTPSSFLFRLSSTSILVVASLVGFLVSRSLSTMHALSPSLLTIHSLGLSSKCKRIVVLQGVLL